MDEQMIILIVSAALTFVQTGSFVGIATFLAKLMTKKLEDSTGLKGDLGKLNKKLSEVAEQNQVLQCKYDALMLEMKGIKQNGYQSIGKNREAKK